MALSSPGNNVGPPAGGITYLSPHRRDSMDDVIMHGICDATDNLMFPGQADCTNSAPTFSSLMPPAHRQFDSIFNGAIVPSLPVDKLHAAGLDCVTSTPESVYTSIGLPGGVPVCNAPTFAVSQPMPILTKENLSTLTRQLPDVRPPPERPRETLASPPTLSKTDNASYTETSGASMSPLSTADLISDRERLAEQLVLSYRELHAITIRVRYACYIGGRAFMCYMTFFSGSWTPATSLVTLITLDCRPS